MLANGIFVSGRGQGVHGERVSDNNMESNDSPYDLGALDGRGIVHFSISSSLQTNLLGRENSMSLMMSSLVGFGIWSDAIKIGRGRAEHTFFFT